jgi:hypothetical protein
MTRQESLEQLTQLAERAPQAVIEETLDFLQFLVARQPEAQRTVLHDLLQLREAGLSDLLGGEGHEQGLDLIDVGAPAA